MNAKASIRRFKQLDQIIEQSEAEAEAARWEQAQRAAETCASEKSQREFAEEVGKHVSHIGRLVAMWRKWGDVYGHRQTPTFTDAYRMIYTGTEDVQASKEADQLRKRLPAAPEKRAEFLVEQLNADPEVAQAAIEQVLSSDSLSERLIRQAVHLEDSQERAKNRERAEEKRKAEALPLPAYMNTMVLKMDEWCLSMQALEDDLADLPEGRGREMVAEAAERLEYQAWRWVDRLKPGKPQLQVIEGKAS